MTGVRVEEGVVACRTPEHSPVLSEGDVSGEADNVVFSEASST